MLSAGFLSFGTGNILGQIILCHGAVLCTVGYLDGFLESIHYMPGALSSLANPQCLLTLPNVPPGAKLPLTENHQTNSAFRLPICTKGVNRYFRVREGIE